MAEWVKMALDTDRDKENCKTWLSPFCDDMTPVDAQILVDPRTDRTKKLKVVMRRADGSERTVIRSWLAGNLYSIAFK